MGRALPAISNSAAAILPRPLIILGMAFASYWRRLGSHMFGAYRPERHYMRGPGPACQAKTGGPSDDNRAG